MQFLASLMTLLKTVPALVTLVTEIVSWMKETFGEHPEKFIIEAAESFKSAREAKTPQEKRDAAVKIAQLIRKI